MPANSDLSHRYLWDPTNVDAIVADETVDDGTADDVAWTLADHLGSVRDLVVYDPTTETVSVVKHVVYDAYGNVTSDTATGVESLFLYTARPFDPDTALQNNLNRWYDATTGRWLSTDPIGFEARDVNLYRYVGNGITVYTDPSGTLESAHVQVIRFGKSATVQVPRVDKKYNWSDEAHGMVDAEGNAISVEDYYAAEFSPGFYSIGWHDLNITLDPTEESPLHKLGTSKAYIDMEGYVDTTPEGFCTMRFLVTYYGVVLVTDPHDPIYEKPFASRNDRPFPAADDVNPATRFSALLRHELAHVLTVRDAFRDIRNYFRDAEEWSDRVTNGNVQRSKVIEVMRRVLGDAKAVRNAADDWSERWDNVHYGWEWDAYSEHRFDSFLKWNR